MAATSELRKGPRQGPDVCLPQSRGPPDTWDLLRHGACATREVECDLVVAGQRVNGLQRGADTLLMPVWSRLRPPTFPAQGDAVSGSFAGLGSDDQLASFDRRRRRWSASPAGRAPRIQRVSTRRQTLQPDIACDVRIWMVRSGRRSVGQADQLGVCAVGDQPVQAVGTQQRRRRRCRLRLSGACGQRHDDGIGQWTKVAPWIGQRSHRDLAVRDLIELHAGLCQACDEPRAAPLVGPQWPVRSTPWRAMLAAAVRASAC